LQTSPFTRSIHIIQETTTDMFSWHIHFYFFCQPFFLLLGGLIAFLSAPNLGIREPAWDHLAPQVTNISLLLFRYVCITFSDSSKWFSLYTATEQAIFKSACSTWHFALPCYPSSLSTAERQRSWCCSEPKNAQESKSPPQISPRPLPFGRAASGRKEEIKLDAASTLLDERSWQKARATKQETWNALGSHGMAWINHKANYFFRIARWISQETKFLFISHHDQKLGGFNIVIKNRQWNQIFILIISVQCRIHVCIREIVFNTTF